MIVGITGTIGAGKGTVVDYLVREKGFAHRSVRDFLLNEIAVRGLPPDRDSMRTVGNELRAMYSPSYIIEELWRQAEGAGGDTLIESVRAVGEASFLKEHGVLLLAVDADRKLRYGRITARGLSTDHVDFETFVRQEELEMSSGDPSGQNLSAVMAMADYRIENDGTREELDAAVDGFLRIVDIARNTG